jgi:hypothetical protein
VRLAAITSLERGARPPAQIVREAQLTLQIRLRRAVGERIHDGTRMLQLADDARGAAEDERS